MTNWFKYPIGGKDAQWIGYCDECDDYELQVSRGGFYNGGITHCYCCGKEKKTKGFRAEDIESMKLSCKFHWRKYPVIPYNWHKLTEEKRKKLNERNQRINSKWRCV